MRYSIEFHGNCIYRVWFDVGRHIDVAHIKYLLENQLEIPKNIDLEREYITDTMNSIAEENSTAEERWNWMFDDADITVRVQPNPVIINLGALLALQGVSEKIDTIAKELKKKGFDKPKGFTVLEGYIENRIKELE